MSLKGNFSPPGDKSISHRIALMSLLADGECRVKNCSTGKDVRSSLDAVKELGSQVSFVENEIIIKGAQRQIKNHAEIDCGNSGTTMRLIMGILSGLPGEFILDGDSSLRKRPMERIALPLRLMGASIETREGMSPVKINGRDLKGIEYELPVASAQLKSAVLLAGIQADGKTRIIEPTTSRDHTERLLDAWGGKIDKQEKTWLIEKSKISLPESFYVPGDTSSAAFFLCAGAIIPESRVKAEGVLLNPTRTGFLEILKRMNANIKMDFQGTIPEPCGSIESEFSGNLKACEIKPKEIPSLVDEVPILALVATQARGTTIFNGVAELKIKESDRLAAISSQLGKMGAKIIDEQDKLIIEGPTKLKPVTELDSFGDHRIAMTLRLAALLNDSDPVIHGEESIAISYPGFHETLTSMLV
ncbi:3-phosphoshikimate 1-carboxyvinyltransferase 1 [Candidatus Magnetomoraceae bacterium gMMP-15]